MSKKEDTRRLDPLSAESAQLEEGEREWRQSEKVFVARIEKLESKIAKTGRMELDFLTKAGVDGKSMVRLLAIASEEEGEKHWAVLMRSRQKVLKSTAGRMKTLANVAERRAKDPFSMVQPYVILGAYGGVFGVKWPSPLWDDPTVQVIISGMRILAKRWEKEAAKFGRFLEAFGDVRINLAIPMALCRFCMLLHIAEPIHWEVLANLFADAFEASGKNRAVSAESLQKTWKKYGKKMLRSLLVAK